MLSINWCATVKYQNTNHYSLSSSPDTNHKNNNKKMLLTPWRRVLPGKLTNPKVLKKFPAFLWNPKTHYRIHSSPTPVQILSQIDPIHVPSFHQSKIHVNIILPSTTGSSKWSPSLKFLHQNPLCTSPIPTRATWRAHLSLLYFITRVIKKITSLKTLPSKNLVSYSVI